MAMSAISLEANGSWYDWYTAGQIAFFYRSLLLACHVINQRPSYGGQPDKFSTSQLSLVIIF